MRAATALTFLIQTHTLLLLTGLFMEEKEAEGTEAASAYDRAPVRLR